MEALEKLKIELPYDSAITFLGIYLNECIPAYDKDTCTPMFTVAFFPIAKLWNQPRYPPVDE
jgi:hypothetical protein